MDRRTFMKIMGGIMSLPILGKVKKPVEKVIKSPVVKQGISEAEKLFFKLVDAVKNKGIMKKLDEVTDYSRGGAYHEYKGAEVLEDGETITAKFKTDKGAPAEVTYFKPSYNVDPEAGTVQKIPGYFEEAQEVGRINPEGDVDIDVEFEIIDSIEDVKKLIDE